MKKNVNSKTEKNETNLQENLSSAPNFKKYLVVMDENDKVKGYFPLKKKGLGKDWVALYQRALSLIADMNLSNELYRVFLKLLGRVDFDNYLTVDQKSIAKELNIKQPNIAKAIKALKELNFIMEGPRAGLHKTYRLNPYIGHKGTNREQTEKEYEAELARCDNIVRLNSK